MFSFKDSTGRSFDEIIYLNDLSSDEEKRNIIKKSVVNLVTSYIIKDEPKNSADKKKIKKVK